MSIENGIENGVTGTAGNSSLGSWAPSTNTPTLPNPPTAPDFEAGQYYTCSDDGTQFGIDFTTNDRIIVTQDGANLIWGIEVGGAVDSVFGRTGVVVATDDDYTASQITNTPAGNITATDVQGAIDELALNKAAQTNIAIVRTTNGDYATVREAIHAGHKNILVDGVDSPVVEVSNLTTSGSSHLSTDCNIHIMGQWTHEQILQDPSITTRYSVIISGNGQGVSKMVPGFTASDINTLAQVAQVAGAKGYFEMKDIDYDVSGNTNDNSGYIAPVGEGSFSNVRVILPNNKHNGIDLSFCNDDTPGIAKYIKVVGGGAACGQGIVAGSNCVIDTVNVSGTITKNSSPPEAIAGAAIIWTNGTIQNPYTLNNVSFDLDGTASSDTVTLVVGAEIDNIQMGNDENLILLGVTDSMQVNNVNFHGGDYKQYLNGDGVSLDNCYNVANIEPYNSFNNCRNWSVNNSKVTRPDQFQIRVDNMKVNNTVFESGVSSSSQSTATISSITRDGNIATVTCDAYHLFYTGQYIRQSGVDQSEYNIGSIITVTDFDKYTFVVDSGAVTPATGVMQANRLPFDASLDKCIINGATGVDFNCEVASVNNCLVEGPINTTASNNIYSNNTIGYKGGTTQTITSSVPANKNIAVFNKVRAVVSMFGTDDINQDNIIY